MNCNRTTGLRCLKKNNSFLASVAPPTLIAKCIWQFVEAYFNLMSHHVLFLSLRIYPHHISFHLCPLPTGPLLLPAHACVILLFRCSLLCTSQFNPSVFCMLYSNLQFSIVVWRASNALNSTAFVLLLSSCCSPSHWLFCCHPYVSMYVPAPTPLPSNPPSPRNTGYVLELLSVCGSSPQTDHSNRAHLLVYLPAFCLPACCKYNICSCISFMFSTDHTYLNVTIILNVTLSVSLECALECACQRQDIINPLCYIQYVLNFVVFSTYVCLYMYVYFACSKFQ